jgi:two-component system, chemotaxis family, chemotaxis protein CheV
MNSALGSILLEQEILLESGTNELEVLVFSVGGSTFGINVAKVREILPRPRLTELPRTHASVFGLFQLRDKVIPVVSLIKHLALDQVHPQSESKLVLTDFNQQQTAFLVDSVEQIYRVNWKQVQPLPCSDSVPNSPLTGIVNIKNRMVMMLDFETIIDQITNRNHQLTQAVAARPELLRHELSIMLADDSPTVRQAITKLLHDNGYTKMQYFQNGQLAWNYLDQMIQTGKIDFDLIVSDVEMPQMDGMHLTKRIKEHAVLKQLPVVLYSSIVTPDNFKKGKAVGADLQISKPDLHRIIEVADELLVNRANVPLVSTYRANAEQPTPATAQPVAVTPVVATPVPAQPATPVAKAPAPVVATKPVPAVKPAPVAKAEATLKIDPMLWATFHDEIEGHLNELQVVLDLALHNRLTTESQQAASRVLHTIKSAASVIPIAAIRDVTHSVESLLEPSRRELSQWPQVVFERYVSWINEIVECKVPNAQLLDPQFAQSKVLV